MFQVIFTLIAVVGASVHLAFSPERRSSGAAIAGTYLLYLLFFYVGLMGVLTAYAHVFRPVETSASIGWSTSPYEYEVLGQYQERFGRIHLRKWTERFSRTAFDTGT
jgi:cytochrome b561